MKYLSALLSVLLGCASSHVSGGDDDTDAAAIDAAEIDAAAIDAPAIDAPDAAAIDARVDAPDASTIDAPDAAAGIDAPDGGTTTGGAQKLLLSEVSLAPNEGELIEIVNPGATAVDLAHYYVSDAQEYWRLPSGVAIDSTDFIAHFPASSQIAPHGVITVAIDTTANFMTNYGVAPTYSIASATMVVVSTGTGPTLTNTGEPIALFYWDGQTDLVTDVDIMIAGTPSAANVLLSKSGVVVDGPDIDITGTAYASDANVLPSQSAPASGRSTKRLLPDSNQASGGNGVGGHDETSEILTATWDSSSFTVPTPGSAPASITN